jgi:hypothetical protein
MWVEDFERELKRNIEEFIEEMLAEGKTGLPPIDDKRKQIIKIVAAQTLAVSYGLREVIEGIDMGKMPREAVKGIVESGAELLIDNAKRLVEIIKESTDA